MLLSPYNKPTTPVSTPNIFFPRGDQCYCHNEISQIPFCPSSEISLNDLPTKTQQGSQSLALFPEDQALAGSSSSPLSHFWK